MKGIKVRLKVDGRDCGETEISWSEDCKTKIPRQKINLENYAQKLEDRIVEVEGVSDEIFKKHYNKPKSDLDLELRYLRMLDSQLEIEEFDIDSDGENKAPVELSIDSAFSKT